MTDFSFGVKRSVLSGATVFIKSLHLRNRFLRNCRPLKISLLQCYEAIWIHNIDAICSSAQWSERVTKPIKLFSTYLALLGSYGLQRAKNSLIALKIARLGPPNSKMGCYLKIRQVLANLWPIYRDRKSRIF